MKKILALVLTIVMVAAMAVPSFAAGHKAPEIVITNETSDGYYVAGATIKYEITLADNDATSIKVGNKSIAVSDFSKNSDGTYTYKGTYTLGMTDVDLKFVVKDMDQTGGYEFEKSIKFKVDPSIPVVRVSAVTTGSAFKLGIISIIATDNVGLSKISVNGKTVADEDDIKGKKTFVLNHDVAASGTYIIAVTDTAGNASVSTVKFNADGTASSESISAPTGGNIWNGGYFGGLAGIYKDNPQLYYYLQMLQNNGEEIDQSWWLWYIFSQNDTTVPGTGTPINNWYFLYQQLMNNKDMTEAEKQIYLAIVSGKLDIKDNSLYWYLFQNGDFKLDSTLLYYLLGNTNGSFPSFDFNENYLAYQYFFGNMLNFVDGADITDKTKDGKLSLTAPEVKDDLGVSYSWKKYINGSWKTVGTDSETITVTPVKGDKYKVIISSEYFYTTVTSDVLTVTDEMLTDDKDDDVVVTPPETDDEDKFSSDDITINGGQTNYIKLKVGEKAYLIPNINGYWTYDTEMFSGTANTLAILTAKKAGTTVVLFTGINSDGETATKSILVEVVE